MAEYRGSQDAWNVEERLIDQIGDAIGGEGSISIVSAGDVGQRHAIVANVLTEAEGMGCLTAICDCRGHASGTEPLTASLSALNSSLDRAEGTPLPLLRDNISLAERSYHDEMYALRLLRSITEQNPVVLVLEEIGTADMATIVMFCFLARNIGRMNTLIIATHQSYGEDRILIEELEKVRSDVLVHDLHLHNESEGQNEDGIMIRHAVSKNVETDVPPSSSISHIIGHINSSKAALASGDVIGSLTEARAALGASVSIGHYGLQIESGIALGVSLTHAGKEKESLDVLDHAMTLAETVGEHRLHYEAHLRRAELFLFSVGEPDSALAEVVSAEDLWSRMNEETIRIGPLALMAVIEAGNGRRDRSEKAFCEACGLLERQPADSFILERLLLALAAAILLESRHDLTGMNLRYGEAEVFATGTDFPEYWGAIVSLQHGRSLLRLRRPTEAMGHLNEASRRFDCLGNIVQSTRVKRVVNESEFGPVSE
jgi:hypothetical protein